MVNTAFTGYWSSYPSAEEAGEENRPHWSKEALSKGIVAEAIKGLAMLLDDHRGPKNLPLENLGEGLVVTPMPLVFRGTRFAILGKETISGWTSTFRRALRDRVRETVCCCVLPSIEERCWPLPGEEHAFGGASLIPLYPTDVDALAGGKVEVTDLLEYKLHRRLVLDKSDPATQFDKVLVRAFLDGRAQSLELLDQDGQAARNLREEAEAWVEHPLFSRVRSAVDRGRGCLLVGPSSSGKSVLALQVGRSLLLAGEQVSYLNLGQTPRFPTPLFQALFGWSHEITPSLVILDDLQSDPAMTRFALAVASAACRSQTHSPPTVLAVSWVDFAKQAAGWFEHCLPVAVRSFQLRDKLAGRYRTGLSQEDQKRIIDTFGDDLFLLHLSFKESTTRGRLVGPSDLAQYIWEERTAGSDLDEAEVRRLALVVASLGRFDIPTPPAFLKAEAVAGDAVINGLIRKGLLRRHASKLSIGHRSLCGLVADWLASSAGWEDLDRVSGPRNTSGVVLDYLRSLGSSLAVESLRALHARAGFKDRPRLNRRAAALVELWEAFNAVLERIEHQQMSDPTWGSVPSSAMFAVAALSEVGKVERATNSLSFLRRNWNVEGGRIEVATENLSTRDDFAQIKIRMAEEDLAKSGPQEVEAAEDIDADLFHHTWFLGLLLCAEASSGKPLLELDELASLVEAEQLVSGAFYPERVPWSTARVLLGLAACGRTVDTSPAVDRVVRWLLRDRTSGGPLNGGLWHSGTGRWNSTLETTGMVLLALASVGFDCTDPRLDGARTYLLSQRHRWAAPGSELDGALALQAFLDTGGEWEEVAIEAQRLSQWAKGEALWQSATRSAKESLDQSCRVAQIASHLVSIGWSAIRSDLPGFLDALATPDLLRQEIVVREASPNTTKKDPTDDLAANSVDLELDAIRALDLISLLDCTVVGGYRRFEEVTRNRLRDWKNRIQSALSGPTQAHENFLIWAAPGSGKSYFVQEIARELGCEIEYFDLNLARLSKNAFCAGLIEVKKAAKPVLCLLDEIDARADETWPYEESFSLLDLNLDRNRAAVFVLIGSDAVGMEGMVQAMLSRTKGQDLLDRVPVGNRFEIPGLELQDRIVIVASQVLDAAAARGHTLREIEKFALYYAVKNRNLRSPRQLRDLSFAAMQRVAGNDDRLKYDDLFHRGDTRNQEFWMQNSVAAASLANTFVRVEA